MNSTDPRGESDLLALARSVFVYIHNMVWAVNVMKVNNLGHGQTQIVRGWDISSAGESLGVRGWRDSLHGDFARHIGRG